MKRLLIVEDDASIRESLVDFFGMSASFVRAAADARSARVALGEADFDAVLLDLQLPDGDGLELLREMRRRGDHTPVLIVTARGAEEQRIHGLRAGADDYVLKPFSVHELAARIDAVLRRSGRSPTVVRIGEADVDFDAREIRRGGRVERMLQKEAELLAFLLQHAGKTFRREELLREVWGYSETPTTRTVDTHVFQLRKKLEGSGSKPRHLVTVHGVGYRLCR